MKYWVFHKTYLRDKEKGEFFLIEICDSKKEAIDFLQSDKYSFSFKDNLFIVVAENQPQIEEIIYWGVSR